MADDKLLKLAELEWLIIKEAVSPEHKAIQASVEGYAEKEGFTEDLPSFVDGRKPDVLRYRVDGAKAYLFVGEAKVAAKQRANDPYSRDQLRSYLGHFRDALGKRFSSTGAVISGGLIVLGTDAQDAVAEWEPFLTLSARVKGLKAADGTAPKFRVEKWQNIWVTIW